MNVSILIPINNPDETLDKVLDALKRQKFKGKVEDLDIDIDAIRGRK